MTDRCAACNAALEDRDAVRVPGVGRVHRRCALLLGLLGAAAFGLPGVGSER